jgi:hypothetical protein
MNISDLILLLFAAMPPEIAVPAVAEIQPLAPPYVAYETGAARSTPFVTLVGGMDGGARGGSMGGMTGGGMGGMTGGGMMGGGMGGMSDGETGGLIGGGMGGGLTGSGASQLYGRGGTSGGDAQPMQYYQCVAHRGYCTVASSPGSLRIGASCICSVWGRGAIK